MAANTSHVMKLSGNGQVSLPASARHRWNAERILVVDLGDHVVMRPLPDDAAAVMYGKYADRGPTADQARRTARSQESAIERRRTAR